jgi:phospholipase C
MNGPNTPDPSRRDALKVLSALVGTTAVSSALGGCEVEPGTDPTEQPTPGTIDTVIVLMMENRSFDHYFGSLSLDEGRTDVDGLQPGMSNPDLDGVPVAAFPMTVDCLEDPPHGWTSSRDQFNEGANDGFVRRHHDGRSEIARQAIGYYRRQDLPAFYALADNNALCQRWFSSVMGSTWPNRLYALCGTCDGIKSNDLTRVPFMMPSIFNQLDEAGVSWRIYVQEIPFAALLDGIGYQATDPRVFLIDDYYTHAAHGELPQVCFVDPGFTYNDDHPPHAIALGQVFVASVYKALADGPQWERSLMIVDYDEHGGFFDHVPPPLTADDLAAEGFDQLGFRIPALVLGPWVKSGVIDTQYDHTSVLKHLQNMYGLPPLTARNAAANDLSDCIDTERLASGVPRPPTELPTLELTREDVEAACILYAKTPGQPELEEAADRGLIPPRWDFRYRKEKSLQVVLATAERQGILRFVDRKR